MESCFWEKAGPIHQILLWLNSEASSPFLTDLSTERKSMATGSRPLVGTTQNKTWLLKSALICASWRGDCLLGPVVTLLYQPALYASSHPAWRSLALPSTPSLLCLLYLTQACAQICMQTHIHNYTQIFSFCQTHSLPVFLSPPPFFLSIFPLTSTYTNSLSSRTSISRHIIWIRLWVAEASQGLSPQSPSSRFPF